MMNAAPQNTQQNTFGADASQFASNMYSINYQRMDGLIAQQARQLVMPACQGSLRTLTPMNQNMASQQGPNQAQRPKLQQTPQQTPRQHPDLQLQAQMAPHHKSFEGGNLSGMASLVPTPL